MFSWLRYVISAYNQSKPVSSESLQVTPEGFEILNETKLQEVIEAM